VSTQQWTAIRTAVTTLLSTVPGITVVHGYPRLPKDKQPTRWARLLGDTTGINSWTVVRTGNVPTFGTSHQIFLVTNILLVGLLQHNDEYISQDIFDEIVDNVLETFWKHHRLDGQVPIDIQGPATLTTEDIRLVSDTAVHYAEISLELRQTIRRN